MTRFDYSNRRFCSLAVFAVALALCGHSANGAGPTTKESQLHIDPALGPPFALRQRPSLGSATAPVVVVEVSSFRCPFCRRFHGEVFPELRKRYIDAGKVRWVMLNASDNAADKTDPIFAMGRCAFDQGRYANVMDFLYQNGKSSSKTIKRLLADVPSIDHDKLNACLSGTSVQREVSLDFADYDRLKINGTPTFFIRKPLPQGGFTEARIEGNQSSEYFERVLDKLLTKS